MNKIAELKQQRAALVTKRTSIAEKALEEGVDLTPEEIQERKELRTQIIALDKKIELAEEVEAEKRAAQQRDNQKYVPGPPQDNASQRKDESNLRRKFSFAKAIHARMTGQLLKDVEKELHEHGAKEARDKGLSPEGMAFPQFLMGKPQRALTRAEMDRHIQQRTALGITTAATAGNLVEAEIGEVVEYLYPRTVLADLGATFISGLRAGFDLINQDGASSATWEGEVDANAETNPTTTKTAVRPKRLGAYTIFSKQLLLQSEVLDVESWVRRDLGIATGQALEVAALNGSGVAPIPEGILNKTGIGDVAGGTNGLVPTWPHFVELETKVNAANAPMGRRAYLTTPGINGITKSTIKKDAGSGLFVNEGGEVNGYPMLFTTNVPSALDKGTSTGVCHAIIFGNWEELYAMQWGGIDLVVNPYSLDTIAQIRVTINSWWDIAVRHVESFAAMQDALTS